MNKFLPKNLLRSIFRLSCWTLLLFMALPAQAERIYLSGKGPEDAKLWDFKVSDGRKAGEWHKLPVPSNWEQHGFGLYDYGYRQEHGKYNESGIYRTTFTIPEKYAEGYFVRLVFEGSMTMTTVRIDGKLIGEPNQGGYNYFSYPILAHKHRFAEVGKEHTLEVEVAELPLNESLDRAERNADYWVFGGIYRPVYLEILPSNFIDRMAIHASHDGSLEVEVFTQMYGAAYHKKPKSWVDELRLQVLDGEGNPFGPEVVRSLPKVAAVTRAEMAFDDVKLWSPEYPNLYQLKAGLYREGELVHEKIDTFGFRTFEVRPGEGFFLNGHHFLAKGVNRNSFHPDTGRAVPSERNRFDAEMIKSMNANLVRSHQPADREFVDLCNELGLLIVSEVTQWQSVMDLPLLSDLVLDNVTRHHNDPSVIFWANGNEDGFNLGADQLFYLYDLQKRPILHPWSFFGDVYTWHYPTHFQAKKNLEDFEEIYFPTEFLHGLYDGGRGAGLQEMWDPMVENPHGAGVVLWCWADHGIKRTDKDGFLDTDGNHSADGIVGPYGELEASYFTIREIWSPVKIPLAELPANFDGVLPVENHFSHTELEDCSFQWEVLRWSDPRAFGSEAEVVEAGAANFVPNQDDANGKLHLPASALKQGQLLSLRAHDPHGREVMHWQWSLGIEMDFEGGNRPHLSRGESPVVRQNGVEWHFDWSNGTLISAIDGRNSRAFGRGPELYLKGAEFTSVKDRRWTLDINEQEDFIRIRSDDKDSEAYFEWIFETGKPVVLNYDFGQPRGGFHYAAVGFDMDDSVMLSKRWLGKGPYPVWSNRMQGPQIGIWENEYNEGGAGFNWTFPEFKGVFDAVHWLKIGLPNNHQLTLAPEPALPVGISRPVPAPIAVNEAPDYPEGGGLFFFYKIPGVGDKFKTPDRLTPLGGPAKLKGPLAGQVRFELGVSE